MPGFDQGQRLHRLDRGTGVDDAVRIAPGMNDFAFPVHDNGGAQVAAFHHVAPGDLDG